MEPHLAFIRRLLTNTPNPTIFELGMCDGFHTAMLLSFCTTKPRYFGFEPDLRNVQKILATELPQRMRFFPDAVGNVTGPVTFYMATPDPNGCVGSSSISEFTPVLTELWPWLKCQETKEVWCWRLDDFCAQNNVERIDFVWMDVQGAERLVFDGGPVMLAKTRYIWTEYDGGTLYKNSSTIAAIKARFPDWKVLFDLGGDVLLENPAFV
jgi:2-O-methyltransferase